MSIRVRMNAAEIAIQNLATADRLIREGLRGENPNAIVRFCMITEEALVGPAAGEEGVYRHYYYTPTYITVADIHYRVLASVSDLSIARYNDEGIARSLRMYLIIHRANDDAVWGNLQLAQVLVNLEQNKEIVGLIAQGHHVIPLSQAKNFGLEEILAHGFETLTNIAVGEQEVW